MSEITFKDWIIAARPKTLTAALIPVICGHLLVLQTNSKTNIFLSALALISAILIQIGTNFFNDVIDYKNGVDSQNRSGPKRLLQQGKISELRMRAAAQVCFAAALIIGIPLVIKGGLVILAIGLLSIAIGYSYSAPPIKLAYRGLAEPFVVLFFGIIAVIGIEWLHLRTFTSTGFYTGIQLGLLATNLMVINNIRDFKEDFDGNKMTLVARFGRKFGFIEAILLYILVLTVNFIEPVIHLKLQFLNIVWIIPAIIVITDLLKGVSGSRLNLTLGIAALTHLLFGLTRCFQLI